MEVAVQNLSTACRDTGSQGLEKERCYAGSQDEAFQRFHKDVHAPQSSCNSSLLENTGNGFKTPSSSATSIKRERPSDLSDESPANPHKKMADYFMRSILRASSIPADLEAAEMQLEMAEANKCLSDSDVLEYEDEDFDVEAEGEEIPETLSKKARVEDIVSNVKRRQKRKQSSPQPAFASQGLIRNEIEKVKEQLTAMQNHYSKLLTRSPDTNSDVENNNAEPHLHNSGDSLNDTDMTGSTEPVSVDHIKSSPESESRGLPPYLTEMQMKAMTESLKKQMNEDVNRMVDNLMGKIREGVRAQMRTLTARVQEQHHHHHQQRPLGMYGFGLPGMDDLRFPKPHPLYPFPEFGRRLFEEPWRPLPPQFPCPPPLSFYTPNHLPPPLFKKQDANPILGMFPNEQNEALPLVVNTPKKKRTKVTDTRLSPRAGRLHNSENGRDSSEPCFSMFPCVPGSQNPYGGDMLGFRAMDMRECQSPLHHQDSRVSSPGSYSRDGIMDGDGNSYDGVPQTTTLTPIHLRKAKLLFFFNRYPSSQVLKAYFPDVKFNKNNTAQLVKWFSNFREFFYIQMEKYARQAIVEGVTNAEEITVSCDSEIYRILNLHYNRNNQIEVPDYFRTVVEATLREFFRALSSNKDQEQSWKKPIYKVIARMDQAVPEFFKSPNWMEKLADV